MRGGIQNYTHTRKSGDRIPKLNEDDRALWDNGIKQPTSVRLLGMKPIVFTDLDGTLLNHHTYSFDAAVPTIEKCRRSRIPVVPVTSKTRREVEAIVRELGLSGTFAVENGSGIFVRRDDSDFAVTDAKIEDNYSCIQLGCTYTEARRGLRQLETAIASPLKGFGDLSVSEIQQLTNLPPAEATNARDREFSEPFVPPENIAPETIEAAAKNLGLRVLVGGRFCHLIGQNAGKGNAVRWLVDRDSDRYPEEKIVTIGLGDSPNDLELLEAVDRPIIIPGKTGRPHPQLGDRGWDIAPDVAPEGWAAAVERSLSDIA